MVSVSVGELVCNLIGFIDLLCIILESCNNTMKLSFMKIAKAKSN